MIMGAAGVRDLEITLKHRNDLFGSAKPLAMFGYKHVNPEEQPVSQYVLYIRLNM